MTANEQISTVRNTWEAAASGWAKWEDVFSRGLDPVTNVMLDMAGIGPGLRVLDVACGAGHQTLLAARRVGPNGEVTACDISETMLEHVRRNADAAGLKNVSTIASPAERLPASDTQYDAAICRLGLMLFPDPASAVNAIRSLLKASGRLAGLVFTTPTNNPFMAQPMSILLRHAGKEPPSPGQPGIFSLGQAGVLEDLFGNNGFADVQSQIVRSPLNLATAEDALQMIQQAFGAYRAVVADLSADDQEAAWSEVLECLKQFESENGFETELEFVIASGAAP
jgi:ubiquinone/menaquinone biosynthesis C-methylase UbiE